MRRQGGFFLTSPDAGEFSHASLYEMFIAPVISLKHMGGSKEKRGLYLGRRISIVFKLNNLKEYL